MAPKEYHGEFLLVVTTFPSPTSTKPHLPLVSLSLSLSHHSIIAAGHDMKSLALNFASIVLFFLPFVVFFYSEHAQIAAAFVAGCMVIALLVPPIGWRRPHPYSDDPNNTPYPRKSE